MNKLHQFGKFIFQTKTLGQPLSDAEFEALLSDVAETFDKHGIEVSEWLTFGLPDEHYPIQPCARCRYLTLDVASYPEQFGEEHDFPELDRIVHRGREDKGVLLCEECLNY